MKIYSPSGKFAERAKLNNCFKKLQKFANFCKSWQKFLQTFSTLCRSHVTSLSSIFITYTGLWHCGVIHDGAVCYFIAAPPAITRPAYYLLSIQCLTHCLSYHFSINTWLRGKCCKFAKFCKSFDLPQKLRQWYYFSSSKQTWVVCRCSWWTLNTLNT